LSGELLREHRYYLYKIKYD